MTDELQVCPFCGGEPDLVLGTVTAYVRCMQVDCEAMGPVALRAKGDNEAARLWNTRASPPLPSPDVERDR